MIKIILLFFISFSASATFKSDLAGTMEVKKSKYANVVSEKLAFDLRYNLMSFSVLNIQMQTTTLCLNLHKVSKLRGSYYYLTKSKGADCSLALFEEEIDQTPAFYNSSLELKEKLLIMRYDDVVKEIKLLNLIKANPQLKNLESSIGYKYSSPVQISIIEGEHVEEKRLKDGEYCQDVDDSCADKVEPNCNACEHGSFTVINSKCKKRFSKICGHNNCGEKGAPACIRGYQSTKLELPYCFTDSPVGFCKNDLRVFCHNNLLICE